MKPVRTFQDLGLVVANKLDCYDFHGHKIDFIRLMQYSLVEIVGFIQANNLYYNPNDLLQ